MQPSPQVSNGTLPGAYAMATQERIPRCIERVEPLFFNFKNVWVRERERENPKKSDRKRKTKRLSRILSLII